MKNACQKLNQSIKKYIRLLKTYSEVRCSQKLIFRQFVLARDFVVLAIERCAVIYSIWKKGMSEVMLKPYADSQAFTSFKKCDTHKLKFYGYLRKWTKKTFFPPRSKKNEICAACREFFIAAPFTPVPVC